MQYACQKYLKLDPAWFEVQVLSDESLGTVMGIFARHQFKFRLQFRSIGYKLSQMNNNVYKAKEEGKKIFNQHSID